MDGWLGINPRWTRLSFSFYLSEPGGEHARAPESALAGYLDQARAVLASRPRADGGAHDDASLFDEFDRLRWFELPAPASRRRWPRPTAPGTTAPSRTVASARASG